MFNPAYEGEILKQTHLEPLNINTTKAAQMLGISHKYPSRFINSHVCHRPEFALRLQAFTGKSPRAWSNIQNNYDLCKLKNKTFDVVNV